MNAWKSALVILSASALAAAAQPGERMGRPLERERHGPHGPNLAAMLNNERVVEQLGLTPEQVSALQERADAAEKANIKLRSELELAELEVRRLMRADKPDRDAIMKAVEAAGAAHLALRKARIEERLAFREIAGPDATRKAQRMMHKQLRRYAQFDDDEAPRRRPGKFSADESASDRRGPPIED